MKAVILTSQRSGSTFLQQCLDAHPSVKCYGELLVGGNLVAPAPLQGRRLLTKAYRYLMIRAWDPVGIMERYYGREEAPVVAFKLMYNHADRPRVKEYLAAHREIRIIHLRRDNVLKQHVSRLLLTAKRERAWQPHTDHPVPVVSVRVSPQDAIEDMRRVRNYFLEFERLLSGHRKVELIYERLFNERTLSQEALGKIAELLEIEPMPISSGLVKMNPNELRQMVENYDELVEALADTEFERFLD